VGVLHGFPNLCCLFAKVRFQHRLGTNNNWVVLNS
jgi:hypothetical protein